MGMENCYFLMEACMKELGKIIKCMGKEI